MTRRLTENGRKASVRGCSSMVEQKLPKLHPSAEICPPVSKTPVENVVWNQTARFWRQNRLAPPGLQSEQRRPPCMEVQYGC